ncbi:MAG: EAL domain-containing protein [Rhodobiaceae bacterium]|nr:EAL domain-containing protein [Rhodobiaceae bacterium]MCC0053664.1 EAL domain-containing protein [Rhodobiaceae bacterium]
MRVGRGRPCASLLRAQLRAPRHREEAAPGAVSTDGCLRAVEPAKLSGCIPSWLAIDEQMPGILGYLADKILKSPLYSPFMNSKEVENHIMNYGRGLNSLRVRFTLLFLMQFSVFALVHFGTDMLFSNATWIEETLLTLLIFVPASILTYHMTGKLTRPIEQLKQSTEAIAKGNYDSEVNVDCQCEVGGLADSFRGMVDRLNDNVRKINKLAFEDSVTGLPNRAVLSSILDEHKALNGAVLFIDLDRFKLINDTLGHQAGDAVLEQVAQRILSQIPRDQIGDVHDLVNTSGQVQHNPLSGFHLFRFAGDEFVMLVGGDVDRDQLAGLARDIIASLEKPFEYRQNQIRISATVGISMVGQGSRGAQELVKFADIAMYAAKREGTGGFAFFDDEMRRHAEERARLESELGAALENHEFVMHYQPKIDAATGRHVGMEALVRWQHPRLGLLLPGRFMEVVESTNMVGALGQEVMRLVAGQIRQWRDQGYALPVSINVCPSQFLNPGFAQYALDFIRLFDLDPGGLELELTETVAMGDPESVRQQLDQFTHAGIRVSIDDFGTGYSNLTQLYRLPFNTLKLDRSLTRDLVNDERSRTIVAATIRMAHALGHDVIAEGVETEGQALILRQLGCDQFQGFHFAYPMSAEDLREWEGGRLAA